MIDVLSNLAEVIPVFIVVILVVVVVHEAGHFLVAKAAGVYCKTFSIGFGPKLLRKRFGETEYVLSAFPLGGYVKMAGEGAMEDVQDAGTGDAGSDLDADGNPIPVERYFSSKGTWARLAIVVAGPLMNLVLAFVLLFGMLLFGGIPVNPHTTLGEIAEGGPAAEAGLQPGDRIVDVAGRPTETWEDVANGIVDAHEASGAPVEVTVERVGQRVATTLSPVGADGELTLGMWPELDSRVGKVKRGSPAWEAGVRFGDRIVRIDGQPVSTFRQISEAIVPKLGQDVSVEWVRDGQAMSSIVVPIADPSDASKGVVGFISYAEHREVGLAEAFLLGGRATWNMVEGTAVGLGRLVAGREDAKNLSGPIRIAQFSAEALRWGVDRLVSLVALFSVNLFLLNLLPIPVLDGGHVVFITYEMIFRRPPNERVQMWATQIGFVALLLFMAFALTNDVFHVLG